MLYTEGVKGLACFKASSIALDSSLNAVLRYFGLESMTHIEKDEMRQLILLRS